MAEASITFRIFFNSTFSDLKEERNALLEHVFPRLRGLCMQHGYRFQAIDLHWGLARRPAGNIAATIRHVNIRFAGVQLE